MSELFHQISALMLTGRMYVVDTHDGTFDVLSAAEFAAIAPFLGGRLKPCLSIDSALELCKQISVRNAGRN